jgi:hypothetical protein
VDCDDVFSDAGSTPAASTTFPKENEQFSSFFPPPPTSLQKSLNFRPLGDSRSSDSGPFSIMKMRRRSTSRRLQEMVQAQAIFDVDASVAH